MRYCHRSVRIVALAVVTMVNEASVTQAQELALAERGPRFLFAERPSATPRPVDVRRTPVLRQQIALHMDGATLAHALAEITRQSGLAFVYSRDVVSPETRVHIRAEQITVAAALTEILLDAGVDVLLSSGSQAALVKRTVGTAAQPGSVAGRVTDARTGQRLEGTEVLLDGTRWRTLTGPDGQYLLADVDTGTYVVTARRIGYTRQSRSVTVVEGQEATMDFALQTAVTTLGEVVVTAQKREERLEDVPLSIAVISNQDIERRGLIGMEDYLRSIPSVNQIDNGALSNAIVIRGITTSPEFENFSSGTTVGSYFDETPITAAAGPGQGGIDVRPVDIERIEILRGPQGTAYGSASLSGAMRMIPVRPKLDGFGAKLAASYSSTSGFGSETSMMQGVVNIPVVVDKFALRAVGYRYDESGFYRNIAGIDPAMITAAENLGLGDFVRGHAQDDVGRMRSTGGRFAALWQATDKLNLSMNFLTQEIEQDGTPVAMVGKFEQSRAPIAPQGRVRGEVGEVNDTDIDLVNLVLNYDLGWAELTSAASLVDGGSGLAVGGQSIFAFFLASGTSMSDYKSFTAETRLASQLEGRFQFLGGLFYEDVEEDFLQDSHWPGTPATNPVGTDPIFRFGSARQLDQRAVFGEVSYDLTDRLTATVGGRYFKYDKNDRILLEGGLVSVPIGAGIAELLENSEDGSSFKTNLSYKPTPESLLYASWAQGFRLGRPDVGALPAFCDTDDDGLVDGTSVSIASTRRINSDFLDNYEIGAKFTLFDRRMVVDASVYHIKWDGLPIRTSPTVDCAYTANAGAATSDGVEFQASVIPAEGLRLDFGGAYTRAELSEDAPGLGAQEGARLPGSPQLSANLAAQYDFDVGGSKAFLRSESFYAGKFYGDLLETPGLGAGDYIKVDARAGVAVRNLSVELFVRNLTNEDAFTWRGTFGRDEFFGYRLRPRTVGVQLGYNF